MRSIFHPPALRFGWMKAWRFDQATSAICCTASRLRGGTGLSLRELMSAGRIPEHEAVLSTVGSSAECGDIGRGVLARRLVGRDSCSRQSYVALSMTKAARRNRAGMFAGLRRALIGVLELARRPRFGVRTRPARGTQVATS